MKSSYQGVDY